ncbi:hypothetical protein BH09BAC1_BH09BAC1_01610 [soil metagenome]
MRAFTVLLLLLVSITAFPQRNMTLLSNLDYTPELSDIWGYAANGREYALVGLYNAVSIVDVTDPVNPVALHNIPGASTVWRDLKTWGHYAYVTNEGGNGLLVIDLAGLPATINSINRQPNGLTTAHNVFIDENGIAYILGGNGANKGALMLNLNTDPWNPPVVGNYSTRYVHDAFVRNDTLWTAEINDGIFSVVNVSNKSNPVVMATQATTGVTTHNLWLSDDGKYLYTTDEVSNANIDAYDVSDLSNIRRLGTFKSSPGQNVIPHNVFLKGNFGIISYYRDGIVVFDATQPNNMIEVGNYDTSPFSGNGYNGAWGVYPYLPSGNVLVSDIENGLYVLGIEYKQAAYLTGLVTDSNTTAALTAVTVTIQQTNTTRSTSATGRYNSGVADSGLYNIVFSKTGYISKVVNNVLLRNGLTTTLNVQLIPQFTIPVLTGTVVDSATNVGIPNANVRFESLSGQIFSATTNAQGNFTINNFPAGYYEATAGKWGYVTSGQNTTILSNSFSFRLKEGWYDDFSFSFGWTANGTATSGLWTRGIPYGTDYNGSPANPDLDVAVDYGKYAMVTGNLASASAGDDDIDGGYTRLVSPIFDVNGYTDPYVSYYRWFFNDGGSGNPNDYMTVRITNGTDTVLLESITTTANSWTPRRYRVSDYVTPTATMKLIVEAADVNPGHLVEAGLDLFRAWDSIVPPSAPTANFSASALTICPGDIITFTDLSTDDPAAWQWSFPGGTPASSTAQNPQVTYLAAGTYSVTLVASNSIGQSTATRTAYITVREAPTVGSGTTSPTCVGGNDGAITLTASGNFAPYHILWSTGDTTVTKNNLAAGSYTATVTDANGCITEILVDVDDPSPLNIQIATTALTQAGATDGTATATVVNGTAPYSFAWSTGTTGNSIGALALGQYQVTVTDGNGCTGNATFIIDVSSGVNSPTLLQSVKVYPNPFASELTLEIPAISNPSTQIRIYHITGQLLESHSGMAPIKMNAGTTLPTGVYFVEIIQGSEKALLRIIKTN